MIKNPILIKKKKHFDKRGFFQEIYLLRDLKIKMMFSAIAHSKKMLSEGYTFKHLINKQKLFMLLEVKS